MAPARLYSSSGMSHSEGSSMPSVREFLGKYLQIPGVRAAVLAGREGLRIEAATKADERLVDVLSALGASALSATDALGQELNAGSTIGTILEFESGLVCVDPLGDYGALVIFAADAGSLARVRQTTHALRTDILRALEAL
jgi:predicted regulator of Ras-like GTPase activity (Roadblock/LC7/MglB family)